MREDSIRCKALVRSPSRVKDSLLYLDVKVYQFRKTSHPSHRPIPFTTRRGSQAFVSRLLPPVRLLISADFSRPRRVGGGPLPMGVGGWLGGRHARLPPSPGF